VSIYVGTEGGVTAFDKHTLQSVEFASHPRDLVANVAVDATHVYWLLPGAAQLWAAPKL
jgi:hypothetical protein